MLFNLECIIFLIIILYSVFYGISCVIIYNKYKKIEIKNASGLYVAKDILNKNNLGTLYVTRINGKHNDHYDIERNVIRLSEEVYEKENLSSLTVAFLQTLKVLSMDKNKRKEKKLLTLIADYSNKIFFILFIIGAYTKSLDLMSLSLVIMIIVIVIRYSDVMKKSELIEENIKFIKKEYKIKEELINCIQKYMSFLLYNEISLHIFFNKY